MYVCTYVHTYFVSDIRQQFDLLTAVNNRDEIENIKKDFHASNKSSSASMGITKKRNNS